ncbi:hypothetical protein [Priestia megaterium]|uniref:hypothetical protein n=1 Tax=Priestia megaterium TaxID=1404 RepID=UPI0034D6083C
MDYESYNSSSYYYYDVRPSLATSLNKESNLYGGNKMKVKYKIWFMYTTMAVATIILMTDPVWP